MKYTIHNNDGTKETIEAYDVCVDELFINFIDEDDITLSLYSNREINKIVGIPDEKRPEMIVEKINPLVTFKPILILAVTLVVFLGGYMIAHYLP